MTHNPILEELYAIREQLLAEAGGDVREYLAGVRGREAASGRLLGRGPGEGGTLEGDALDGLDRGCSGPAARFAEPG